MVLDGAVYINLRHRTDRREKAEARIPTRLSCQLLRVEAQREVPGFLGCVLSHRKALETCLEKGWKRFAVFEDDFVWNKDVTQRQVDQAIEGSADNADCLYLALNTEDRKFRTTPCEWGEQFRLVHFTHTCSGIVYHNRRAAEERVRLLGEGERQLRAVARRHGVQLEHSPKYHDLAARWRNDQMLRQMYGPYSFVTVLPPLGRQEPDFSDLLLQDVDYRV